MKTNIIVNLRAAELRRCSSLLRAVKSGAERVNICILSTKVEAKSRWNKILT